MTSSIHNNPLQLVSHLWLLNIGGTGPSLYGGYLKWWYATTMGFPTKNDHFWVFGGYHYLRKHPYEALSKYIIIV